MVGRSSSSPNIDSNDQAREWNVATVGAATPWSRAVILERSSAAADLPKVRTSTDSGESGCSPVRRATTASTMVVVFPVPGPARTSSGDP